MQYISDYKSPLGTMLLAGDEQGLTGLWFDRQKYYALHLNEEHRQEEISVFTQAKEWLDVYFAGKNPGFTPKLHLTGSEFQNRVWEILLTIPYGHTMTYGDIAKEIAIERGVEKMSAQAVGGAVGHNDISVIVPCHRVIGANGNLTGYAGGLDKKIYLLTLEGVNMEELHRPFQGTAL